MPLFIVAKRKMSYKTINSLLMLLQDIKALYLAEEKTIKSEILHPMSVEVTQNDYLYITNRN